MKKSKLRRAKLRQKKTERRRLRNALLTAMILDDRVPAHAVTRYRGMDLAQIRGNLYLLPRGVYLEYLNEYFPAYAATTALHQ